MLTTDSTSRNRWLWPLALFSLTMFALALRWYYVSTALVYHPVRGDATQYYAYAWNLVHHGTFSKDAPGAAIITPDNYRDPGYPLFLALWMKALGTGDAWYAAVLLCQAMLGALTVTVVTQLGRFWLTPRWAIGAGVLMAVWPHSIVITSFLLTETQFGFLCALGLLAIAQACQRRSLWLAAIGGLVLGSAALTNAVLLPFGILLSVFMAWRKLAAKNICVALAAGALFLPGAWAIRNIRVSNPTSGNSSMDRALQNLAQGASPDYHAAYRDTIFGDAKARVDSRAKLRAIDQEYELLRTSPADGFSAILHRAAKHPARFAAWYLLEKPYALWGWSILIGQGDIYVYPTMNSPFKTQRPWIALEAICQSLNLPLMLLTLASLLVAWSSRRSSVAWSTQAGEATLVMMISLVVFATLVYTALQAEPRYSIPFRPFEMLLALTTLAGFTRWWQERRHSVGRPTPSPLPTTQHE